jgi:tetratricopeptide (TPR) repeat protein
MAFGFGFNKQKVLSAAEKYVQQGKLQNAITEYEKVLKADPKDLTVNNTVGDLYSRLGEADKATECFKSVGDAYASQGFTVKAIAMYKKISKLKPSLESVLKLAELYTQQGLFNDARAQYLQVAEEFLKSGELDNAVRIFQKILEMDPENVNMRVRLAEVYVRLGKKNDAWQIFSAAAETMRSRGSLGGAEEVLQRMLTLDPGNAYALLMQGRNLLESGDAEGAIASLQKVSDLDSNPEGLRDLLKAYLQTGQLSDAGTLANKLLSVHNDLSAISSFADALMQAGQYENALQVYDQHADRLLSENSEKVLEHLHSIIGHVRDNPASLEKLLELFHKAGENTHLTEVIELLAHASVQSGDLPRARDLYQKLATLEPQNPLHMKSYQQVVGQLGGTSGTKLITAEEAAVIVDELEATAPSIHQHYSDEVSLSIRSALTDAELFISYNMPAKGLGPLVAALPLAPHDLRLNQRLAALHTRAERFAEAAVCCRTLQTLYSDAGYPDEATRYGELADRYEERSSPPKAVAIVEEAPAALELSVGEIALEDGVEDGVIDEAPEKVPAISRWPAFAEHAADEGSKLAAPEAAEFSVIEAPAESADTAAHSPEAATPAEIDLSSEWEDSTTVEGDAPVEAAPETEIPAPVARQQAPAQQHKTEETVEEIRFYLSHGMADQALAALAKLQTVTQDHALLAELRAEIEAATQAAAADQEAAAAAESLEEIAVEDIPSAELTVEEAPVEIEEPAAFEPVHEEVAEIAIEAEAPVEPVIEPTIEPEPVIAEAQPAALKDFVTDLESSLGDTFLPGAVAHEAKPAPAAHVPPPIKTPTPPVADLAPVAHVEPASSAPPQGPALGEFVADLEESLGEDFLKAAPVPEPEPVVAVAPAPVAPPKPVAAPPVPAAHVPAPHVPAPMAASAAAAASGHVTQPVVPSAPAAILPPLAAEAPRLQPGPASSQPTTGKSPFGEEAGVDLAEMFGELKQDLESGASSSEEDPETHYNLGIAFREMGLLDEAIGELQKACQSIDRGHPFPQIMQACTWLAQCFLEKGIPEAAVRWYDKALAVPGIDGQTRVALHYELACAYETAGDKPSALKHFMDVYGNNIDYRDVSERIKALKS